jgi:hypothetical protein
MKRVQIDLNEEDFQELIRSLELKEDMVEATPAINRGVAQILIAHRKRLQDLRQRLQNVWLVAKEV